MCTQNFWLLFFQSHDWCPFHFLHWCGRLLVCWLHIVHMMLETYFLNFDTIPCSRLTSIVPDLEYYWSPFHLLQCSSKILVLMYPRLLYMPLQLLFTMLTEWCCSCMCWSGNLYVGCFATYCIVLYCIAVVLLQLSQQVQWRVQVLCKCWRGGMSQMAWVGIHSLNLLSLHCVHTSFV